MRYKFLHIKDKSIPTLPIFPIYFMSVNSCVKTIKLQKLILNLYDMNALNLELGANFVILQMIMPKTKFHIDPTPFFSYFTYLLLWLHSM